MIHDFVSLAVWGVNFTLYLPVTAEVSNIGAQKLQFTGVVYIELENLFEFPLVQ